MVSDESIEKTLNVEVASREGEKRGVGSIVSYDCRYDTGLLSNFSTEVRATSMDGADQELLDSAFKTLEDDRTVGDYQRVTGIGALAGFGRNAIIGKDLEAWDLAVVMTIGGERLLVTASTHGQVELDQLKTLAEEFLTNLESAVGT
ncbi:hypothetical protein OH799_15735 [Nocardia sp. NBC_00881]|uniref:hypothetical protein n=1 Tax=Nocardia sp. NBC_00881 TaxID=2975995 RepID=UPI003865C101|nr:hypothetical protein OH799_15735 [Nocardia sp. NBC_00881]